MNNETKIIEQSVSPARIRWRRLRFARITLIYGTLICLVLLTTESAIYAGWITTKTQALAVFAVLATLITGAMAGIGFKVIVGARDPGWLAAAIERCDRRFQDRLNTLIFLERKRGGLAATSFRPRIAEQALKVVTDKQPPAPFSAFREVVLGCVFLISVAFTCWLTLRWSPAALLTAASHATSPEAFRPLPVLPPTVATNELVPIKAWGEVRIAKPGADLRVSKADVVPLQIQAAADKDLTSVAWFSSVNGAPESIHPLGVPQNSRYAEYAPTIKLEQLQLSDWDVLSYYAKAVTAGQQSYASDIYFVEVRPTREDMLKLPGGAGGRPYGTLSQLTSMIGSQQSVIRSTHQHIQNPPALQPSGETERASLEKTEGDLADSAKHLCADLAANLENQPLSEVQSSLTKAEASLLHASRLLKDAVSPQAQEVELRALSELVAARKTFEKDVGASPANFANADSDHSLSAGETEDRLKQMAEFRDEAESSQEFVRDALKEQQSIEQQAENLEPGAGASLAQREQQLDRRLKDFETEHPKGFKGAEPESAQAHRSLEQASEQLNQSDSSQASSTREATQTLQALASAMDRHSHARQLADLYRLKRLLEQEARALESLSKPETKPSSSAATNSAQATRDIVDQMRKDLSREPIGSEFGPSLHEALSEDKLAALEQQLDELRNAQTDLQRARSAAGAARNLSALREAFGNSQPGSLRAARQKDALQPDAESAFAEGIRELKTLRQQLEQGAAALSLEQAKRAREAASSLQLGLRSQFKQSATRDQLLRQLDRLAAQDNPEASALKQVLAQLEYFATEAAHKTADGSDPSDRVNFDPARLPLAYRNQIETYFEELSAE